MADNNYKVKWERCQEYCRARLDEQHFTTWIKPVSYSSYNEEKHQLKLSLLSHYCYEYIEEHYAHLLRDAISQEFGPNVNLFYKILADKENRITVDVATDNVPPALQPTENVVPGTPVSLEPLKSKLPDLDPHLMTEYSFDNFIEGESNLLPRSVGMSIADNPKQKTFNPLFIYGRSGVGKTHLVNAIGVKLKTNFPEKRVLYLSAHLFHVQYVDARLKNKTNDFIHFYQQIDVLILDDVHEFIGMDKTQETFFHIFNHLKQNGKQIILTCDRSPVDLQGMTDRLITRFKWGLVAELGQPNEKLRHDILESKINRNGLKIPKSVVDYISENVTESVRELEGVVTSLIAYSVVYNRNIDLPLARHIVSNATRVENKPITIDDILAQTCHYCNVRKDEVFSKSRKANIVEVRQIAMYLAHKFTKLSTSKIGILIGNRNHTTVIHSISVVESLTATDAKFRDKVEEIEKNVKLHKPLD